jgi:hypothetical protein
VSQWRVGRTKGFGIPTLKQVQVDESGTPIVRLMTCLSNVLNPSYHEAKTGVHLICDTPNDQSNGVLGSDVIIHGCRDNDSQLAPCLPEPPTPASSASGQPAHLGAAASAKAD